MSSPKTFYSQNICLKNYMLRKMEDQKHHPSLYNGKYLLMVMSIILSSVGVKINRTSNNFILHRFQDNKYSHDIK